MMKRGILVFTIAGQKLQSAGTADSLNRIYNAGTDARKQGSIPGMLKYFRRELKFC
jgi:hypothetical protein